LLVLVLTHPCWSRAKPPITLAVAVVPIRPLHMRLPLFVACTAVFFRHLPGRADGGPPAGDYGRSSGSSDSGDGG